jgi:hypothetical protein
MKVEVYFNLHKKLFSVRSVATGRVMFHTYEVCIDNPKFVVRKAGRDKVLRERKKNVHAFVRGDIRYYSEILSPRLDLSYNPYKAGHFVNKATDEPVYTASCAFMQIGDDTKPTIKAI